MRLEGRIAVITGAGSGMGKAMAERFVREGAKVVLADRSGAQDAVAESLGQAAVAVHADVAMGEDVQAMIAKAVDHFGRLDILINNAGFGGKMGRLADQSEETWDEVHAVNLKGVFLGMKYGIRAMLESGGGVICNIASAAGAVTWEGHSVYGAAKAGVIRMTQTSAIDYVKDNIRINAICPGTMWTGLVPASRDHPEPPPGTPSLPGVPMGRWGLASDIANAALFLVSDEANYITGVSLPVDGGWCAR